MKRSIIIGLIAVLAISGCQVKEEGGFAPEGKPFTATMEAIVDDATDVETKTSLDNYGNIRWKRGDQVSIYAGSTINEHYQVTDASDGRTTAALNRVENPEFIAGSEIPVNAAYYPYTATAEIAKGAGSSYVISYMALPSTQNYARESFGNGAFPMTAVTSSTSDYNLKFKNVLGGLKLQLKGTATITSISITGNNNEKLCGDAEVTVSNAAVPSITLNDEAAKTVILDCGDGVQLNANTATVFIIALPPMTMSKGFTITVIDSQNKQMEIKTTKSQTITRSNLLAMPAVTYEGISVGPQYVDLGLSSGLKWASCNVGASAPEEYGDYFAWGETEPHYTVGHSQDSPCSSWEDGKTGYHWVSYQFRTSGDSYETVKLSKYVTDSSYGTVDNKTVLDPEDDAASVNWGGTWRIPTDAEWTELREECSWTWTTQNNYNGYLVVGPNGNSIFLPATGFRWDFDENLNHSGFHCVYWSSSIRTDEMRDACGVDFVSGDVLRDYSSRCDGQSVRPVSDEGVRISVTGVSLNTNRLNLVEGGSASIMATVTPSNATQSTVIWSSSNTTVATVDYNGVVIAVSAGSATITATTYDRGFTATCNVTVWDDLLGDPVDLSADETANSYIVSEAGYYSIDATVAGNGKAVRWPDAFAPYAYPAYNATTRTVSGLTGNGVTLIMNQNDCVSDVSYKDGKILFKATGAEGNAKVTLTNNGIGVWTWHIWCTDAPASLAYYIEDAVLYYHIMDRNMGAISDGTDNANCEEVSGLYYQYGNPIGYTYEDFYNQGYQGYEFNGRGLATMQYSLALNPTKPTLNITLGDGKDFFWFDLWYDGVPDKIVYSLLWGGGSDINGTLKYGDEVVKTLYDPCPAGYKIMGWDTFDSLSSSKTYSGNANGLFIPAEDGDIFLPYNGAAWPDAQNGEAFWMGRGPYDGGDGPAKYSTLWLSGHVGRNMAYFNMFYAASASAGKYERSASNGHIVGRGLGVRCMADEFHYE